MKKIICENVSCEEEAAPYFVWCKKHMPTHKNIGEKDRDKEIISAKEVELVRLMEEVDIKNNDYSHLDMAKAVIGAGYDRNLTCDPIGYDD